MIESLLNVLKRSDQIACLIGFAIMAFALIIDVGSRILFGSGVLGAVQVGVVGMIILSMFGIGLAADAGDHLRPRFFDGLVPPKALPLVQRIADLITASFFALLAVVGVLVAHETFVLGDVNSVLRWPNWPLQALIAIAFGLNVVRYLIYAISPSLRPQENLEEAVGGALEGDVH